MHGALLRPKQLLALLAGHTKYYIMAMSYRQTSACCSCEQSLMEYYCYVKQPYSLTFLNPKPFVLPL